MIRDPILTKLVAKQTEDLNNGASEEVRIENYKNIVKRQKEMMKMNKGD
jgi:hypothetical protein